MLTRAIFCRIVVASFALAQPTTRERGRFSLQGDAATLMAVDAQVKTALIAFSGGTICVFPADQRIVNVITFPIHKKAVTAAVFVSEGKSFVTTSADGTLKVWDVLAALKHHKEIEDSNGDAKPAVPKPSLTMTPHAGYAVMCLAIRPDGKQWATGGSDGTVKMWNADTSKMQAMMPGAHPGGVKAVQYSPDGKLLATCGADKSVKFWDPRSEKPEASMKLEGHAGTVNAICFSPDGKQLASGTGVAKKTGTIHVWDVTTGKEAYKLAGHEDVVNCLVFHPKTAHLASGGADSKIRVWDLAEKKTLYTDEHAEALRNFVVSPDGARFGSCSAKAVRWWAGFGK